MRYLVLTCFPLKIWSILLSLFRDAHVYHSTVSTVHVNIRSDFQIAELAQLLKRCVMKWCKVRDVLGRVIIKDWAGDHHQHQQGRTEVYTCLQPLEGVLLPQSPP